MASIGTLVPGPVKRSALYRVVRSVYFLRNSRVYQKLRQRVVRNNTRLAESYLRSVDEPKLQVGCGENPLPGWLNCDFYPHRSDVLHLDARSAFPFPDSSFELVFSEHVIEHLPIEGGLNMLLESWRVLVPGGRIRISTPPLETLIDIYNKPDEPAHHAYMEWHRRIWLPDAPLVTPAVVFNDFVRNWGHLLIYDAATLRQLMTKAGFIDLRLSELQQSDDSRLTGLENEQRMPAGLLKLATMTIEGVKPLQ